MGGSSNCQLDSAYRAPYTLHVTRSRAQMASKGGVARTWVLAAGISCCLLSAFSLEQNSTSEAARPASTPGEEETSMLQVQQPSCNLGNGAQIGVDGGCNRACRGIDPNDNSDSYFDIVTTCSNSPCNSVDACRNECGVRRNKPGFPSCQGAEYSNGRCELWSRAPLSSVPLAGHTCTRFRPREGSSRSGRIQLVVETAPKTTTPRTTI